jgi:NitT/TauT family transport system ATP-binding protein
MIDLQVGSTSEPPQSPLAKGDGNSVKTDDHRMGFELIMSNVSHSYGSTTALQNVSASISEGETVAVIGPSGCGKSTLLSILGGLIAPSEGTVTVRGRLPKNSLNPFTFVFQDFALLPWRTVAGNVALALEHHRLSATDRRSRVEDALARTGLSEFAKATPKQLSGGMRQRVGIARALVVEPAIFLMDEPLSALDAQTRELLMDDFESLWKRERTTTIYVTHNLDEAIRMADRIMVLKRRPGTIREIVEVPIPRNERKNSSARTIMQSLHDKLWMNMRQEAQLADREVGS